jgi:dihydroorotate dehydrogenase electron transfer subunit
MKDGIFTVISNKKIANGVFKTELSGDTSAIKKPGQFVNFAIEGLYLRRPISVCDVADGRLTIIYKTVGKGTAKMAEAAPGEAFKVLTGLGNGYDLEKAGEKPLLIGGGVGVPPLYYLAKELVKKGAKPASVLGFNSVADVFYEEEFKKLGCETVVTTVDGSYGLKGFVTDALPQEYTHFYTCGPLPMLKAVFRQTKTGGQFSLEERMGCGFGACMGCSMMTANGAKRVCKDGPVFEKSELLW